MPGVAGLAPSLPSQGGVFPTPAAPDTPLTPSSMAGTVNDMNSLGCKVMLGLAAGVLAVPLLGAGPAQGAAATGTASLAAAIAASAPGCADVTPAAVASHFDGALPKGLAGNNVPGAVVSVVSGGQTVFAKGYGVSDVERQTPFSATDSMVRIASISKLFTWTAVMQQVEAGRLDLDTDVNRYLTAFRLPATFAEPVTLRMLMNHTAGFEDRVVGTAARTAGEVQPLERYLADHIPDRIYPPGEISAYSNYGAALAGYIVSQVSGEPWDAYIQHHLLDPLDMRHSTASEPVPAALAPNLAHSYNSDTTPPRLVPFEFDQMPPDGGVSATAVDMANFMVAHLHDGQFNGRSILSPTTAATMHERSFAADPRLAGYAHGFQDKLVNGHRALEHDGGWEGFLSVLVLVPDCDLGLFLSTNATGGVEAATGAMDGFFDQFAPDVPAPAASSTVATKAAVPGFYKLTRHNESTIEKLLFLLGPARLTVQPDATVRFRNKTWTPDGHGLYETTGDRMVFLTDADGRQFMATNGTSYERIDAAETLPVNLVILAVFGIPALTALAVPVVGLWRRLRRRPQRTVAGWRWARSLAAGAALGGLVFLVLLLLTLIGDTGDFIYGPPLSFTLLLSLPILALLAAAGAIGLTVRSWRGAGAGVVGVVSKVHQVMVLIGLVALTWFLWTWNLIGWHV
jgi:CubicO group peptidase (beta-lactamase class C family)